MDTTKMTSFWKTNRKVIIAFVAALIVGLGFGPAAQNVLDIVDEVNGEVGSIADELDDSIESQTPAVLPPAPADVPAN